MRQFVISAVLAATMAVPAAAAIRYEFRQTSRSDAEARPNEITGRVHIEGSRRRVDYLERLDAPARSSLITDGNRSAIVLNHTARTYTETDPTAALLTAMGTSQVQISNLRSETVKLDDRPTIAGVPTQHYRISVSYDVSYVVAGIPLRQTIQTLIEQWTTTSFDAEITKADIVSGITTGDPATDRMLDEQMQKIQGLPLRQLVTITARTHNAPGAAGAKLSVRPSRSQRAEFLVTNITTAPGGNALFTVPAGFKRVDSSGTAADSNIHVLELQTENR